MPAAGRPAAVAVQSGERPVVPLASVISIAALPLVPASSFFAIAGTVKQQQCYWRLQPASIPFCIARKVFAEKG